jgi:hypothetical protein
MTSITDIREALPEIAQTLASARGKLQDPTPAEQVAIRAVWSAVDATRMYLGKLRKRAAVPPTAELVALWSDASLKMAAFDLALANRLRTKAEYWSDPMGWDSDRIREAQIGIDTIADDARALLQLAVPKPPAPSIGLGPRVFLSHASEDKKTVVEPLAAELRNRGILVWYDTYDLKLGDNLTAELDKGLGACDYGIVVLSDRFFAKAWPQMELNALLALETNDRRKRVIPIRHGLDQKALVRLSPLLAGRVTISTDVGIPAVAQEVLRAIR